MKGYEMRVLIEEWDMTNRQIKKLVLLLENEGIELDKGLTESEVMEVEKEFDLNFPEDLRAFLQIKLPVSSGFVHWRYGLNSKKGKREIKERLDWPLEGMLFDIKENNFWLEEWGNKPVALEDQKIIASSNFMKSPKLIPIYSHRYISSKPKEIGNPIFSVYQMDIIYYGFDLADYLANEFKLALPKDFGVIKQPKNIEFWSKMVEMNV